MQQIQRQPNSWKKWVVLLLIIIIYWFESQLSEAVGEGDVKRKLFNFASVILVMVLGYIGWYGHPVRWIPKLWLLLYGLIVFIVIGTGLINWKLPVFGRDFMDAIHNLRLFFTSPLPFLALFVLSRIKALQQ